jgi:hypothetical protein
LKAAGVDNFFAGFLKNFLDAFKIGSMGPIEGFGPRMSLQIASVKCEQENGYMPI